MNGTLVARNPVGSAPAAKEDVHARSFATETVPNRLFDGEETMIARFASLAALTALAACVPDNVPGPVIGPPARSNLRRGINLGNALEAPNEGEWGRTLGESLFSDV